MLSILGICDENQLGQKQMPHHVLRMCQDALQCNGSCIQTMKKTLLQVHSIFLDLIFLICIIVYQFPISTNDFHSFPFSPLYIQKYLFLRHTHSNILIVSTTTSYILKADLTTQLEKNINLTFKCVCVCQYFIFELLPFTILVERLGREYLVTARFKKQKVSRNK